MQDEQAITPVPLQTRPSSFSSRVLFSERAIFRRPKNRSPPACTESKLTHSAAAQTCLQGRVNCFSCLSGRLKMAADTQRVENNRLGYNAGENIELWLRAGLIARGASTCTEVESLQSGFHSTFRRSVAIWRTRIGSEVCKCWSWAQYSADFSFRRGNTRLPWRSKIVRRPIPQRCRRTWRI